MLFGDQIKSRYPLLFVVLIFFFSLKFFLSWWEWKSISFSIFSSSVSFLWDSNFFRFEELEIKFLTGNHHVLNTTHEMTVRFLTISLTVSIQLSKCLSFLTINFDLLSPVLWLSVTVNVALWELTPTVLHVELSRACRVPLTCLPLLTKPTFVFQIAVWMCLFVTSTVAKELTAHPTVQVTFIPNKCMTVVTFDPFPHSCYLYFGVCDFMECNMKFLLALIWHTNR